MLTKCRHMLAGSWQTEWWIKTCFPDSQQTRLILTTIHSPTSPPNNNKPLLKRPTQQRHTHTHTSHGCTTKRCETVSSTNAVTMTTSFESDLQVHLYPGHKCSHGNFQKNCTKTTSLIRKTINQHYARSCNAKLEVRHSSAHKELWEDINILILDQ